MLPLQVLLHTPMKAHDDACLIAQEAEPMAMKSRITRGMMVLETSVANSDERRNTRYLAFFAAPPPSKLILCSCGATTVYQRGWAG
jgi:hypothetical protein